MHFVRGYSFFTRDILEPIQKGDIEMTSKCSDKKDIMKIPTNEPL